MRRAAAIIALVLGACLLGGCHKPLFPSNLPRTQYDAYEKSRGRYVPLQEPDVFGNPQPALRARLSRNS